MTDQLLRERERCEELVGRLNKVNKELSDANQRENEIRTTVGKKDKEIALVKHNIKELQRKVDQETDMRKRAEGERSDMRRRMEDEINKRTREQNNSHMVAEKISNLEREKREMAEKMKRELENVEKMKKINTELSVSKTASESTVSDLNDKLAALSEDRNLLERELAKQQSQLQLERNQRNEVSSHSQELDAKVSALMNELSAMKDSHQTLERDNTDLSARIAELEKIRANLDLELKNSQSRYKQMMASNSASTPTHATGDKKFVFEERLKRLESQLSEEKSARSKAESALSDKDRELSMLSVDYRKVLFKLDKSENELRTENEKLRNSVSSMDRLREEKSDLQSHLSEKASEITMLKTNEKRLARDLAEYRERAKSYEEELVKIRTARSVDELQRKELEDQLETEQHFRSLYKTQATELQDEVDESKEKFAEIEAEKKNLARQLQQALEMSEQAAVERRVLEEDLNDLEKEKMMLDFEIGNQAAKQKADVRNLEIQLAAAKDTESDLIQRIDLLTKDQEELTMKIRSQQDEIDELQKGGGSGEDESATKAELVKIQKLLETEKLLKQQAVNKLAEIMNRKDFLQSGKKKNTSSSQELRKKEKENRKLQQELKLEKEKFDQMVAKYVKEQQDLHATIYEESQWRNKLQMELDTKESELEQLQIKLAQINVDTASLSSGLGGDGCSSGDPPSMENMVMISGVEMAPSLEGWLQIPSKQNIRRHGWKKVFVTVSSKKIIFFNSEADRQNADATLILDLK